MARNLAEDRAPAPSAADFDAIYDDHVDVVWRALRRFGVAEAAIEDSVQEVFIVAYKKLHTFEGRSSVSTWLYGIAAHVARNAKRSERRHPETPTESVGMDEPADDDPEASVSDAEAMRILYRILDELDHDKREVFVLAELEQLSAPEISVSLGVNVNTIYARLRAARAAFELAVTRHRARGDRRGVSCP